MNLSRVLGILLSKKKIVLYIVLIACIIGVYAIYGMINNESESGTNGTQIEQTFAAEPSDIVQEEWMADEITYDENKYTNVAVEYQKKLKEQGFSNIWERKQFIEDKNLEYQDKAETDIDSLGDYIDNDNQTLLKECAENISSAQTCKKIQENEEKYKEIIEKAEQLKKEEEERIAAEVARQEAARQVTRNNSSYSGGNNFKRDGIWRDSQYEYSWYSSNTLRHYRTNEWSAGSDGIYRDSNGRVCAASDDYSLGTVVNTEKFGEVVITDTGVGTSGRLDIYTNF